MDSGLADEDACAFEELCERNGIDMSKSTSNRFSIKKLEMFFDGYPKIVGLQFFPFLSEIVIIGQGISKIENLIGLHHLKELWLADCRISTIDALSDLTHLEKLYLHGNRIKKIESLGSLKTLRVLWLARNYISTVENLSELSSLVELNLAENRIQTIGRSLDMNTRLETLNLSGNPIVSFKELVFLSRHIHLKSLSFRDAIYRAAPIAESVNYSTQVLFYLPNLEYLDSNEIRSKQMQDLVYNTVNRKKAFYDMRLNGLERTVDAVFNKMMGTYQGLLDEVKTNMALLTLSKKEMMCYMQHELGGTSKATTKSGESCPSEDESTKAQSDDGVIACRPCEITVSYSVEAQSDSPSITNDLDMLCSIKMAQIDSAMLRMQRTILDLDISKSEITLQLERIRQLWKTFLRIELETAGNVFFDFGTEKDPWFNYCRQLVASRFCTADYSTHGITRIHVLGAVRISNRHQRNQFDLKLESAIVDKHEQLWQLTMIEIARRANIEYLFYSGGDSPTSPASDTNDLIAEFLDLLFAIEHGFYSLKTDKKSGVPLTNSLFWADRRRFPSKTSSSGMQPPLQGALRFGQALLCKTFCGHYQTVDSSTSSVKSPMLPNCDSVMRTCEPIVDDPSANGSLTCSDCSKRIQEWAVFDPDRILPEYLVFFQYEGIRLLSNPFTGSVESLLAHSQNANYLNDAVTGSMDSTLYVRNETDVIESDPIFTMKSPLSGNEILTRIMAQPFSDRITRLCLYNCSLTQIPPLKFFPNLAVLDLALNQIESFPDLKELGAATTSLEHLCLSHNMFSAFENIPLFGNLRILDISWNNLTDLNKILSQLRRQVPVLTEIFGKQNPWFRPKSLRSRFIAAFKTLKLVDGVKVTEEERIVASKLVISASLVNIEATTPMLVKYGRTDYVLPNLVALGPICHQVLSASQSKPKPYADPKVLSWMDNITTLVLDGQYLTKLAGVERLKGLKWASFNDNFLTNLNGIEFCAGVVELLLDNNCITSIRNLGELNNLTTLSLNNNRLASLELANPAKLQSLSCLSANGNLIKSLNGAQHLPALQNLYLANNQIDNIREIFVLKGVESLFSLDLFGNAVCGIAHYRLSVIYHLPHAKVLDSIPVEVVETNMARDYFGGKLSEDFVLDRLGLGPGADLSQLTDLDLPNSNLYTIEIQSSALPNLRSLNLENNNLVNLGSLAGFNSLQVLCLNNNRFETLMPVAKGRPAPAFGPKSKVDSGLNVQAGGGNNEGEFLNPILPHLEVLYLAGNAIRSLTALQLNRIPSLVTLFLQNNEITTIESIENLTSLRDLVLDRNRVKGLNENSFAGQYKLAELHMEENRLRDLSFFHHLRNLRRLYLGSNKLQMASELDKLQDLRKLHEISLVNNPLTRKNVHRAVILYYLPQLHLIDGMPVTEEDITKAQLLANQEDPQGASVIGAASLMPATMTNYFASPTSNPGMLPMQVYQPMGLSAAHSAGGSNGPTAAAVAAAAINQSNALLFYQTNYQSQASQQHISSGLVTQQPATSQQSSQHVKVSNLQLGFGRQIFEDNSQSILSGTALSPSSSGLNPIPSDVWNVRRLRVSPAAPTVLQQMNSKQLFMPPEPAPPSSQQQQDAVAKIHGNKLSRH